MNITDDYNDTLTTNTADKYNDTISPNCTITENNDDLVIPTFSLTKPCGPSFFMFEEFDCIHIN